MIEKGTGAMALVRINLAGAELVEHATGRQATVALSRHTGDTGPVVIMIHGYKFSPFETSHCPHDHILAQRDAHHCWKAKSWPQALGINSSSPDILGIAFGWSARGSIWQAYHRAEEPGRALARLIRHLRQTMPNRPIHILAHSLGARVALSALPRLPAHALDRLVLLAGAEFHATALEVIDTPAGQTCEVISVTSRENRPYDRLLERALATSYSGRAIGSQPPTRPNWLNLPLDDARVLDGLSDMGHDIAPPQRWFCHWSSYLRPGVFSLYTALVVSQHPMPVSQLRRLVQSPDPEIHRVARLWRHMPAPAFRAG